MDKIKDGDVFTYQDEKGHNIIGLTPKVYKDVLDMYRQELSDTKIVDGKTFRQASWDEIKAYIDKSIEVCKEYEVHCKKMSLDALADGRPRVAELYERNRNTTEFDKRKELQTVLDWGLWVEIK